MEGARKRSCELTLRGLAAKKMERPDGPLGYASFHEASTVSQGGVYTRPVCVFPSFIKKVSPVGLKQSFPSCISGHVNEG